MKKVFLIAGEESGDIHAANMIRHLREMADFSLYGTGGEKLKALGQEQYFSINEMAIIGVDGIVRKAPFIFQMFKTLKDKILEIKPDVVILVDYPGFNLRFAKIAKNFGFKLVYFIAPQVWAWNYKRVDKIKKYIDLVLCILPFEEELFQREGINAKFIGNPILDNIKFSISSKREFYDLLNLDFTKKTIGILPGSREKEIYSLMPIIYDAFKKLNKEFNFVLAQADNLNDEIFKNYENLKIVKNMNYDIIKYSDLLWVCSGTATLESAIIGTPLLLMYKVSRITEILVRLVIKTNFIGLPNIIAEKEVVPELLQDNLNVDNLIETTKMIYENYSYYKSELDKISEKFSHFNPSLNAAREIYTLLS